MEIDQSPGVLHTILTSEEIEAIPETSVKKIEEEYEKKFEEFLTAKALFETRKSNLEHLKTEDDQKIEELALKVQDESSKFHFAQQSVKELRIELEDVKQELIKTKERLAQNDTETGRFRQERNEAVGERDTLLSAVERKTLEVDRLQADVVSLETKLKASNNARCEALAKLEEIDGKEFALTFKEKRIDMELSLRDNQIAKLTQDLDQAMHDLQKTRRDQNIKTLTVDTKLSEKTEELKIATQSIAHLTEQNGQLSAKVDDLVSKNMQLSNESNNMMDTYRKQLASQNALCDLLEKDKVDKSNQVKELESAITQMSQLLQEATEAYGVLETEKRQLERGHTEALAEKDRVIGEQQEELKRANELLEAVREENLEHAIEKLAPSAAATSRMIKSGMSLTEVYSLYVRTAESLHKAEKENSKLNLQLQNILNELEQSAPEITRQESENRNLKDANGELVEQVNKMISQIGELQDEVATLGTKTRFLNGENKKLTQERKDLCRQICQLLHEIERMKVGGVPEVEQFNTSGNIVSGELITKKLVTFTDIADLQATNVKLLMVVRDFSEQLEAVQDLKNSMSTAAYEAKLAASQQQIDELQVKTKEDRQMIKRCNQQCDRYKRMYQDAMRSYNPLASTTQHSQLSMNGANSLAEPMMMDGADNSSSGREETGANEIKNASILAEKERMVGELQAKVKELQKDMDTVKEEYETYRREKITNDKMLNDQFDQMRTENREITSKNIKLMGVVDFNTEQNRMMVNNIATYKNQIRTLEERNKNYESTIAKHEATIMYLKDEAMSAQTKLARAEVQLENIKQECRILKDTESRLQTEREILNRERHNQNLLLSNLEMIKVSMERSENEGRLRLEARLDETSRECSALRRRLQEEQDRFREQTTHLQRQSETARSRMDEEIAIAETVQAELQNAREELEIKARKINDLQRKLQETLSPNDEDNPVTKANRMVRELERGLEERRIELEAAQAALATTKEHVKQYADLSESAEKELKDLNELYSRYRETSEAELTELRGQVEELQTKVSLKITDAQLTVSADRQPELHAAQLELKEALEKVAEQSREMREMREKCHNLMQQVEQAESKYANEMLQHSGDIQQLTQLKGETQRIRAQFEELVRTRDQAVERLQTGEESWANREQMLRTEMAQVEERLGNLNSQNAALHDQIQSLSMRLSISAASLNQSSAVANESESIADESTAGCDTSLLNRSLAEDDKHSVEQLLQIIKYLRKEKDIAVARFDLLRSENVRVQTELMLFQKKFEEAQAEVLAAREKTDTGVVTAAKHEEILRKLDMYNAITDSNRVLREERDELNQKVKELSDRLLKTQDELFPLQEKNRDLTVKMDMANNEISTLRVETTRWRQRANLLIERSNKTSTDDWKRMQTERENLAKMLMTEKDLLKHANDELNAVKLERARLETELVTVSKQLAASGDQVKKLTTDIEVSIAQGTAKLMAEVETLKADLKTKDEQLTDAKNKEQQIRKIAKRYKDSYVELRKEMDEKEAGSSSGAAGQGGDEAEAEGTSAAGGGAAAAEMDELRKKLEAAVEEADTLQKGNELLRGQLDKAERNQELLKEAKHRIMSITEQKNTVLRELSTVKGQLQQQLDQLREENDMLKNQYEGRMTRFEKDSADADRESKEAIARLSRENEQLVIRLNQLNRQLGLQQAAKPSTSAVGSGSSEKPASESPRTANVKPMAGPSNQQSATVTPRRVSETPLASIRPMAVGSRTAAVLPTSQSTTNVAIVQGSTSSTSVAVASSGATTTGILPTVSGSATTGAVASAAGNSGVAGSASGGGVSVGPSSAVGSGSGPSGGSGPASTSGVTTALVPPQQQVHSATATSSSSSTSTTSTSGAGNNSNESMASSSPTSSHTDYMPATSSANVAVAAVPPMGTASTSSNAAESSSSSSTSTSQMAEGDRVLQMGSSSSSLSEPGQQQQVQQQPTQQAAVAMVLPHVEGGVSQPHQIQQQQQQQQPQQQQLQQQQNTLPQQAQQQQLLQSAPQASSSNTVTTTQAALKRPRDVEGDSSTDTVGQQSTSSKPAPAKKRIRIAQVAGETFQGVSESGLDVEYQVPTSSQRDQEDDIIVVDSEEEEDEDDEDDDDDEEEEDVGMPDEGTAEADDGPYDGYEAEESYEQDGPGVAGGVGAYDEGEGPDIDEDNNIQSANNEVDVDEDNEVPNPCGTTSTTSTSTSSTSSHSAKQLLQQQQPMDTADVETSSTSSTTPGGSGVATAVALPGSCISTSEAAEGGTSNDAQQQPQIQSTTGATEQLSAITVGSGTSLTLPSVAASSSGTAAAGAGVAASSNAASMMGAAGGVATTRQVVNPLSRQQQQAAHLILMQQQNYEHEGADDRIVPSTPTLYVSRRTDGFSEAVSSPHPQVPNARFTFGETSGSRQSVGVVPTSAGSGSVGGGTGANVEQQLLPAGIDDTRIDLSQLDEAASGGGRSVPTTPHHTTGDHGYIPESTSGGSSSSSTSAGIISTSSVVTTMEVPHHHLLESNTSEAQASSGTGSSSSGAIAERDRDCSEKELLEEEDDDDVDDGVAVTERMDTSRTSTMLAAGDDDEDDDVDMVEGTSKHSITSVASALPVAAVSGFVPGSSSVATTSSVVRGSESTFSVAHGRPAGSTGKGLTGRGTIATLVSLGNEADRGPGDDAVSSEGEKLETTSPMEEGSEAEVLGAPSSNTRSRSSSNVPRGNGNPPRRGRPPRNRGAGIRGSAIRNPITWNEGRPHSRSGPPGMGSPPHGPYQSPHMMHHQQQQQQRRTPRTRGRRPSYQRYQ